MTGQTFLQKSSKNQTILIEVFLLGFQSLSSYRFVFFSTILFLYIFILSGNIVVIVMIFSNGLLHSPMYFFLCNLSLSQMLSTTIITPKMLQVLFKDGVTITLSGCLAQFALFGTLLMTESFLLTVMSYDRFLAICRPLRYSSIMHFWFCCYLALTCWTLSFIMMFIGMNFLLQLQFCRQLNTIDHFFCDLAPIVDLSCSDTSKVKLMVYLLSPTTNIFPFLFILGTYVAIIRSILKIQSVTGKKKAFSTCTSHLTVVVSNYITLIMAYLVPSSGHSLQINKVLSLLYTVITPLLNPFIYSLNNREIRAAIGKRLTQ